MVRFENVGMRYGIGSEILRNVTFELKPGSFHFLTGPSGAGKSSLLKLLYLAHRPSRGFITIFGEDVVSLPRHRLPPLRRRIGVVFQDFRLLDHLTAIENVMLPVTIGGGDVATARSHAEELLAWVGLADRMTARPPTLSGGEKQRLAIARAVIGKPDLILADEPTGNVDAAMGARLLRLFQGLNRMGATVLIASHDTALAERSGAGVLNLEDGRIHGGAP